MTGPGLSTFYAEADGTVAISVAASALFAAVAGQLPSGLTIRVPNGGDVIDETDGSLVGVWGTSSATTITGTAFGPFAAGVGARVRWDTLGIVAGRRVRGATFLCPLWTSAYDNQGTIDGSALTALTTGVSDFLVQVPTQGRVWSRPAPGRAGTAHEIVSGIVPDRVSWLRSRRT